MFKESKRAGIMDDKIIQVILIGIFIAAMLFLISKFGKQVSSKIMALIGLS